MPKMTSAAHTPPDGILMSTQVRPMSLPSLSPGNLFATFEAQGLSTLITISKEASEPLIEKFKQCLFFLKQ